MKRILSYFLIVCMLCSLATPMQVEAKSKRPAVKKVSISIKGKKVTKKTYLVKKGTSATLKVKVTPSKAKKKVTYKTSKKKVATVSKKGKIKAKRLGTSKISVTVKGKNGKKKTTWVKIKVVKKLPAPKKTTTPAKPATPAPVKPTPPKPTDPIVSRGEFVKDLLESLGQTADIKNKDCPYTDIASNTYEAAIQSAWSNGYFPGDSTTFSPTAACTKEFAAATSMLAMGYQKGEETTLSCSDVTSVNELYRPYVAIALDEGIVALVNNQFKPTESITKSAEKTMLSKIEALEKKDDDTKENIDIEYADDTYVVDGSDAVVSESGEEISMPTSELPTDLTEGGYLLVESSDVYPQGVALKVENMEEAAKETTVTGTVVEDFTEIVDTLQVSGTADAAGGTFVPAEGISIVESTGDTEVTKIQAKAVGVNIGADGKVELEIDKKDGNSKIEGSVSFKPTLDYDIDWRWGSLKKVTFIVESELESSIKASFSKEKSIPLGVARLPIPGTGMGCTVQFSLEVGGKGEVSLSASATYENGIKYKKHLRFTNKCTDADFDFSGNAEVTIGPEIDLMLTFFGCELVDVGAEAGGKAEAERTIRDNGMVCDDVKAGLYVKLFIGKNSKIMEKMGFTLSISIIEDGKCIFKLPQDVKDRLQIAIHFEDSKKVEKCTYKEDESGGEEGDKGDTGGGGGGTDDGGTTTNPDEGEIVKSGQLGTCLWKFDSEGTLTISPLEGETVGELPGDLNSWDWPWKSWVDKIKKIEFKQSVMAYGNLEEIFSWCRHLEVVDTSGLDTSNVTNMDGMFAECYKLKIVDVSNFDTGKVTDMSYMFSTCESLTDLDVSGFDTSKVTDMSAMFEECKSLQYIDVSRFDTSKVTDMGAMFKYCGQIKNIDVSRFDTNKVTDMSSMFMGLKSLTGLDVSGFETINVVNMENMFFACELLTYIDVSKFNTSKVTNMSEMFRYCKLLRVVDVKNFDTSKVTDMSFMFCNSESISADCSGWDVSNVDYYDYFNEGVPGVIAPSWVL